MLVVVWATRHAPRAGWRDTHSAQALRGEQSQLVAVACGQELEAPEPDDGTSRERKRG